MTKIRSPLPQKGDWALRAETDLLPLVILSRRRRISVQAAYETVGIKEGVSGQRIADSRQRTAVPPVSSPILSLSSILASYKLFIKELEDFFYISLFLEYTFLLPLFRQKYKILTAGDSFSSSVLPSPRRSWAVLPNSPISSISSGLSAMGRQKISCYNRIISEQ